MGSGMSSGVDPESSRNCSDDNVVSLRHNLVFPNEILEKILTFLSVRDKLVAREVCTDWMNHINSAAGLQDYVKVKISSDELNYLADSTLMPLYTSFYFHKIDLTRHSMGFWSLYSEQITHLEFYDCAVIPRNTADSDQADFMLGCPNLKHLALVNCDKYFLMGGKFIQLHEILCLENLESLNLSRNKNLTDNILFSILLKTKKLKSLDLSECINMVFMKAVHNRFYPTGTMRPPYSDLVLSFHTLCYDFLNTSRANFMTTFNFGTKLNTTGMQLIMDCDHIKWECATLESTELKQPDLKNFISKFNSSLRKIELGRCKLTSDDVWAANLCVLEEFSAPDSRGITNLKFLETMHNLRKFVLDGWKGFELSSEVISLRNLTNLSLNGIQPVGDPATNRIELIKCFKKLKHLNSLDVGNCPLIVNDEVAQGIIANCTQLKSLNLEGSAISDSGLTGIKNRDSEATHDAAGKAIILLEVIPDRTCLLSLTELTDLQHLNLSDCRNLGELTWQNAIRFPNLTSLNLSNCTTLSKRGILSIINNCRNIEKLTLLHCSRLILTDIEILNTAREKLYRCRAITY